MYREEKETSIGPISGEKEGDFGENEVEEFGGIIGGHVIVVDLAATGRACKLVLLERCC